MFGSNTIVGKKAFNHLENNELMVHTVFPTLQGEGPLSGQRSVFLRLSHCQLSCSFCDTNFSSSDIYTFDDLIAYIEDEVLKWSLKNDALITESILESWNLVITGGEPLLQERNLRSFISDNANYFKKVQIESNGLIAFDYQHPQLMLVVSPKAMEVEKDAQKVPVRYLKPHKTILTNASCLKFVFDKTAGPESPYSSIPNWAQEWKQQTGKPIYISPMNKYLREPLADLMAAKQSKTLTIEQRNLLEMVSFWESGLLDMEKNRLNHEGAGLEAMKKDATLSLQTHLMVSLP